MNPEVEKYYNDAFGGIGNLILLGKRRGIDPEQVERAAEIIYQRQQENGPFKSTIVASQRLFVVARELKAQKYGTERSRLREIEKRLEAVEKRFALLDVPFRRKVFDRISRFFTYNSEVYF